MKVLNLKLQQKRKYKATTYSNHNLPEVHFILGPEGVISYYYMDII
jgi:hypothetical protein